MFTPLRVFVLGPSRIHRRVATADSQTHQLECAQSKKAHEKDDGVWDSTRYLETPMCWFGESKWFISVNVLIQMTFLILFIYVCKKKKTTYRAETNTHTMVSTISSLATKCISPTHKNQI